MKEQLKPLYLLADSQLLFWKNKDRLILEPAIELFQKRDLKAAYIGASNKDNPALYEIFTAAMSQLSISDCRMITSDFPERDERFLKQSDIILLAGGNVKTGWDIFLQNGIKDILIEKYYEGALLIGVSAGAVQLGLYGCTENHDKNFELFETLKLVPLIIDVHDENNDWKRLKNIIRKKDGALTAIGVPMRAGMIYHPENIIEAIRFPIHEFKISAGEIIHNVVSVN